jgi:MFS family permease
VWSILLYALSALASGYSTTVYWLLFWRCATFVGVCVEFVAAVAWLSELFPNPRQREAVVGYTQVLGSFGGLMVTGMYYLVVTYGEHLPLVRGGHEAWRYTLMSGIIPAIPLIVIRPFLPESPSWQLKKEAGTLKRPSFAELFDARFRKTTIVTTVMMAAAYAAAFGAIQQTPAHRTGSSGSADAPAIGGRANGQRRAVIPGVRRADRALPARLSRRPHRQSAPVGAHVPGTWSDPGPHRLRRLRHAKPDDAAVEHFSYSASPRSAAQFLGKLSPRVYPTYLRGR